MPAKLSDRRRAMFHSRSYKTNKLRDLWASGEGLSNPRHHQNLAKAIALEMSPDELLDGKATGVKVDKEAIIPLHDREPSRNKPAKRRRVL